MEHGAWLSEERWSTAFADQRTIHLLGFPSSLATGNPRRISILHCAVPNLFTVTLLKTTRTKNAYTSIMHSVSVTKSLLHRNRSSKRNPPFGQACLASCPCMMPSLNAHNFDHQAATMNFVQRIPASALFIGWRARFSRRGLKQGLSGARLKKLKTPVPLSRRRAKPPHT